MSLTATAPKALAQSARKDGVIGLWGRILHRDAEAYDSWLEERDLTIITATLLRLNDRQLGRIGMSRATLALDVEDLVLRADREKRVTADILRLVEDDKRDDNHAIAAE